MLKNHIRLCAVEDCECQKMHFMEENSDVDQGEKDTCEKNNIDAYMEKMEQSAYEILISTIRNFHFKEKTTQKELIIAYVNFYFQGRMTTALYNLMLAEEAQASFLQHFNIFCLRYFMFSN